MDNVATYFDVEIAAELLLLESVAGRNDFAFDFRLQLLHALHSRALLRPIQSLQFVRLQKRLKLPAFFRLFISAFYQEPLVVAPAHLYQIERALKLFAMKLKFQSAFL